MVFFFFPASYRLKKERTISVKFLDSSQTRQILIQIRRLF